MSKKLVKIIEPQLHIVEQSQPVLALSNKIKLSLYKKSVNSGVSTGILEEVYRRGYSIWNDKFKGTREQFAFDRVNSFLAGGFAADLDRDLMESSDVKTPSEKTLSRKYNIPLTKIKKLVSDGSRVEKEHTKSVPQSREIARDRISEKPNYYKLLAKMESTEEHSSNKTKPNSRFDGSNELVDIYKQDTPGQSPTLKTIKRICKK